MFIARQPIFTKELTVYGYELLFRSGFKSTEFDGVSDMQATATVVSGLFESGIDQIVDDKKAFINFDADFLHSELTEIIEPDRLIIEVLETVVVDQDLINRIVQLKKGGYKIALDDFIEGYSEYPLVPYADIIKYDLRATPLPTILQDVKRALAHNKLLLAEKVETDEEYQQAKALGFHLFQGYFFSRPNIVNKSSTKSSSKAQYIRLLTELKKEEPSYQALAEIIEKDPRLAYNVMRIISHRSGDDMIYSIKRALTYLGLKEIERWISILMLRELSEDKPLELMRMALVRSKFAELIAQRGKLKKQKYEAGMMGLFSTLDAMLDQEMKEALEDVTLPESIVSALVIGEGPLAPIIKAINCYEKGEWSKGEAFAEGLGLSEEDFYINYKQALEWARDIIQQFD
jgi:c-di-GMP-related signal transduction protein